MRIRASWRDPYSGVPLMFTSSSPGCSRRDSAALPPSSTWATKRGVRGGTAPQNTPEGVPLPPGARGERGFGKGLPAPQAPRRNLRRRAPPLSWSHEFLSKERAAGGAEEKCPVPADSPAGAGSTRALCPARMPAPRHCSQPHIGPARASAVISMPEGCHHAMCAQGSQQQGNR